MRQKIVAVIIGNEILAGRREDRHFKQTVESLSTRNLRLSQALIVQDDFETLVDTYSRLKSENAIVFSFGGIGATPDDCTRAAVAKAFDVSLEFHPEGLAIMQAKHGDDLNEHRKNLIAFPKGARLIPNPINQVPGFSMGHIHCVPGFPQMATPMIQWVLDQYYQSLGQVRIYQSMMVEIAESQIAGLMEILQAQFPEVSISSLPRLHHELELGFDGSADQVIQAKEQAINWLKNNHVVYKLMDV